MRVTVRVYPRAPATAVGGRYGTGEPPVLVVRVTAPAADGRANRACEDALALAFGVLRGAVKIVAGNSARTKLVDIDGATEDTLAALLIPEPRQ